MLRRRFNPQSGVSEVIGSVLVLVITVSIFSSIILWVYTIPTPTATGRVSFSHSLAGVYEAGSWNGAYINLTHLGGDNLFPGTTRIYLTIDNRTEALLTRGTIFDGFSLQSYGVNGPDANWNIGEVWSYLNRSISPDATISVMVVDIDRGVVLWGDTLRGADGPQPPVFLDKWVDGDLATSVTRDPAVVGEEWTLFARVFDPDGDLIPSSVQAYLTFGTGGCALGAWYLLTPVGGETFRRTFTCGAQKSWDGGIIILSAIDEGGRETRTRAILRVVDLGGEVTGPDASAPFKLGFGTDTQRYDLFEASEWDKSAWDAQSRRTFEKGESVVVVVATKTVPNPDVRNDFTLWDPYNNRAVVYSNPPYLAPITSDSLPSSRVAFSLVNYLAGFYIFEHRWSTSSADHGWDGVQLDFGFYPLEVQMMTSLTPSPGNRFHITDAIRVTNADGFGPDYPRLETYRDQSLTQPATSFNFTERMYVRVVVESAGGAFDIGDVIISDFVGRRPVWAPPGTSPVSGALPVGFDSYVFSVDLSKPNRDSWNFGTASYNLEVLNVNDPDEFYSRLSTQVEVRGPRWKLDIAVGLLHKPHPTQGTAVYGVLFDSAEAWREYRYETYQQSPGNKAPDNNFLATVMADLDGDGDLDILVGTEEGDVLWFRNLDGKGHAFTKHPIDTLASSVTGVAAGHIAGPRNLDVAVATSTGEIWWYRNDGHWTAALVDNVGMRINAIQLADMNRDEEADIVVGLDPPNANPYTGLIYLNEGLGVFGRVDSDVVLMEGGESPPLHATVLQGTYLDTRVSDNAYHGIEEVGTQVHLVAGEDQGSATSVSGTYVDTGALDEVEQVLTEGVVTGSPSSQYPKYTLGTPDGHRYKFPAITADADDLLEVHLLGRITGGSEFFRVGWSKTGTSPTWFAGLVTNQETAELVWRLTGLAWSNETLYLHVLDTDLSRRDQASDAQLSSLAIDHLYAVQTGVDETSSLLTGWRSDTLPAGKDAYKFFVEAHRTLISEDDRFRFKYATAPHGPYYDLLTISKTLDDDVALSVSLPVDVGGKKLYIIAQDSNRDPGATFLDSLFVDYLAIQWYRILPEYPGVKVTIKPWAPTLDFAVADMDHDGIQDVVIVPEGKREIYVYWGDIKGILNFSNSRRDILPTPAYPLAVEVGLISGDSYHDIVVATIDGKLLLYTNRGFRGLWIGPSTIATEAGNLASALRVGDVDGDSWDDVIVGWQSGAVSLYRNDRGGGWIKMPTVANLGSRIDSLDVGDVDRGDIIRTHPY